MGTGYVRTDTANNISNGNVIDADDLDNEFNAVEAAFNVSTGHTHDGTAAEGAPIEVIGPAQDIVATTSTLRPKTTNTVDLGTTTLRYKDLYIEGNADIDGTVNVEGAATLQSTLDVTSNVTIGGNLTVDGDTTIAGNLTFGDAETDTITLTADVASSILPSIDDTYDLGAVGSEWRDLYIDGTANIDTASIDTANITTLAVSGNGTVTGDLTVSGTINATVTGTSSTANALTTARTISISGITSGSVNFDGSSNVDISTTTLTLGGTAVTATGAEINVLDDMTATTAELNTLAGITASTAELNKLDGVTATTAEINTLAGITASTTELNKLDGVTASTAEINTLDGITASTAELNFVDGVTSAIQTQLDAKLESIDLSSYTGDLNITGDITITSTNALTIPVGTTAQRPTPSTGMLRYNSTEAQFEGYNGTEWGTIGGGGLESQTATTTSTTQTAIASYAVADYVALELTVVANDGTDRTIAKLLVAHDGTTAVATQYGEVNTGSTLATFDVDISGGNVRLLATAASSASTDYTTKAVTF